MGLCGSGNMENFQIGGSQQHTGEMNWREGLNERKDLLEKKKTWWD